MARERRLSFGQVAELYDRTRPSYPPELVSDVIAFAGPKGSPALEVGAGTGKATELFAARGVSVLALEPSAEMAALARRRCAAYPAVEVEEIDFERWQPGGRCFVLVFSAQAWHWVRPGVKYVQARLALQDGGALAVFWNLAAWDRCEARSGLLAAYERAAPRFVPRPGPMHPAAPAPPLLWGDWEREIGTAAGFEASELRQYEWNLTYPGAEYQALLRTHSDHMLLPEAQREDLLEQIGAAIDAQGGELTVPYVTRLCLARARSQPGSAGRASRLV
jgi:SAM-dependent methyltransferase